MTEREQLEAEYKEQQEIIKVAQGKLQKLRIDWWLLSDEKQQYKEQEEEWTVKDGRKKKKEKHLVGRIYWKQFFQDEDKAPGEGVWVDRNQIVRVDGIWEPC